MTKITFLSLTLAVSACAQAQWTQFNGHYYQAIYTPNGLTWTQARAAAQALTAPSGFKADLVSCNTQAENTFAFSLVDSAPYWYANTFNASIGPWIGLYQPNNVGDFVWADGTALTFTNWYPGEPNDSGGTEQYGHFYTIPSPNRSSQWNDVNPTVTTFGYVVEAAPGPVPEPAPMSALALGAVALLGRGRRQGRS